MKVYIIEGPDNIGKNTVLNYFLDKTDISTIIHCGKPLQKGINGQVEQDYTYFNIVSNIINHKYDSSARIILNRSWIGEYVYGTLYRERDKEYVKAMIQNVNKQLHISNIEVVYLQLWSSCPNLLVKNEDGKSLSAGDILKIQQELTLFKEIFDEANIIHKYLITVNDGPNFRDINLIRDEINKICKIYEN